MSHIPKLFDRDPSENDGLQQPQREALIDLLVLSMYIDNALSLSEDAVLRARVDTFSWEDSSDVEDYVDRAVGRVRVIKGSPESVTDFLVSVNERLETYEARLLAFGLCERLLTADGRVETEKAFLEQVRQALNLA